MDRRRNLLIGIVVGVLTVGASVAATGFTRRVLSPFRIITAHKSSDLSTAPELTPGDWINSEPLTLNDLRGRVVLIDFWTFGCYNCRNTLPFIKGWDDRYRDKGFTVIGVHSPEFDHERTKLKVAFITGKVENLHREVASLGIRYPVVTDNDYKTWDAYNVAAWPTIFLLDKQGRIRWMHVGEGEYDEAELVIQKLLAEKEMQSEECRAAHGVNSQGGIYKPSRRTRVYGDRQGPIYSCRLKKLWARVPELP